MKKKPQSPNDKNHPYSKRTKQATEKPTIKLGKEDFSKVSGKARKVEMEGVDVHEKKILRHSESVKGKPKYKKMKHHPDDHDGHLYPLHHRVIKKVKKHVKKQGSTEMYS